MEGFDWEVGEDGWRAGEAPAQPRPRAVWLWRVGGAIVILVGLALFGQTVVRQADLAEDTIAAAAGRAYSVYSHAILTGDTELFEAQLMDGNGLWQTTERELLTEDLILNRAAYGQRHLGPLGLDLDAPENSLQVSLTPSLRGAVVTATHVYRGVDGTRLTFDHVTTMREVDGRWLVSPQTAEFWGPWVHQRGETLEFLLPQRDAARLAPLHARLEATVAAACADGRLRACPDTPFFVRFGTIYFSRPAADGYVLDRRRPLTLPTPTAFGLPTTPEAEAVLYAQYERAILTHLRLRQAAPGDQPYLCCYAAPLVTAALDVWAEENGYPPRPLPAVDADTIIHLRGLGRLVDNPNSQATATEQTGLRALLRELSDDGIGPETILTALAEASAQSPPDRPTFADWYQLWTGIDIARTFETHVASTGTLPDEVRRAAPGREPTLSAVCTQVNGFVAVWRVALAAGGARWREAMAVDSPIALASLPQRDGLLVFEQEGAPARTWIAVDDRLLARFEAPSPLVPITLDEREVLVYNAQKAQYERWPYAACPGDACQPDLIHGMPLPSPDGSRNVVIQGQGQYGYHEQQTRPLSLDRLNGMSLGTGRLPTWLDSDTLVVATADSASVNLVDLESGAQRVWLDEQRLTAALPGAVEPWRIVALAPDPQEGGRLVLLMAAEQRAAWLTYNRSADTFEEARDVSLTLRPYDWHVVSFAPDGSRLLVTTRSFVTGLYSLAIVNRSGVVGVRAQVRDAFDVPPHLNTSWSADSQFVALPDNGYLRLLSAADGAQALVVPPAGVHCTDFAWGAIP